MSATHDQHWKHLGDGSLIAEDFEEGLGHLVPVKTYIQVYISLLVLTVITVYAATMDFGILNLAIAMAIATVKAALVTLIFMHLKWEKRIYWAIAIYPMFIFFLLVLGTLGDDVVKEKEQVLPLSKNTGLE